MPAKENLDEAVEFLGWVKDTLLDTEETLKLLHRTLELTGGKLGEGRSIYDFMEGIYDIATGYELMALRCLNKAMSDKHMAGYFSLYEEHATRFMDSILKLEGNRPYIREVQREAEKLADAYGRQHIYEFRKAHACLSYGASKWLRPKNWNKFGPGVRDACQSIADKIGAQISGIGSVIRYNGSFSFIDNNEKTIAKLIPDNPLDPVILAGFSKTKSKAEEYARKFSDTTDERYLIGRPFIISEVPRHWNFDEVANAFVKFMRNA